MTRDEVIDLLALIASYDRRTGGESDITAWHLALGELPFGDSQMAVVHHYRESRDWIMPADVRQRVKAMRAERLKLTPVPPPPAELLDDPEAYRRHLRESARAIADGQPAPRAIGGTP